MIRKTAAAAAIVLAGAGLPGGSSAGAARTTPPRTAGALTAAQPAHDALTLLQQGELYRDLTPPPPPPPGLGPEARARWLLDSQPVMGRSPMAWVRWAQDAFRLDAPALKRPASGDLAIAVTGLYAVAGVPLDAATVTEIIRRAAAVPEAIRAPLAELVGTVSAAYAAQLPVAAAVAARWAKGFDPRHPLLRPAEREAVAARASALIQALIQFRARTAGALAALPPSSGPIFSDPEGLVILGGTGDDTYTRAGMVPDPILLVDPAGNDRYETSAGGACPLTVPDFGLGGPWMECNGLVLSVTADLGDGVTAPSDDLYLYDGPPSAVQGAGGPGALGILVDVGGNDSYLAKMTRGDNEPFTPFTYYFDGGGQGFGYAGVGILVDGVGNDTYRFDVASTAGHSIWAFAQGWGGAGGLGISSDGAGNDAWLSNGLGLSGPGFEGVYTDGVGFYGGVGILTDTGAGNDIYRAVDVADTVDFYAQGFGAFGGLGILYEDGGNDDYYTYEEAHDPFISPLLNCAFGTASFFGVGVMVDLGGNDSYYGASVSPKGAEVMDNGFGGPGIAYGTFVDLGGDDRYVMEAFGSDTMIEGRGLFVPDLAEFPFPGHNTWGTFVDIGGNDTYVPDTLGANDSQWVFGVDRGL